MSNALKDYWELSTPMRDGLGNYEERRKFRYELQDYMQNSFWSTDWKGKRVLEVGCGAGLDSIEFARHGAIVSCIDMTDDAVNLTRKTAKEAGYSLNVKQADATSIPFSDGSFDAVYSYGVLHHIPNVQHAILEINRVLKRDGTLMGMVYNRDSLLYAYSIIHMHRLEHLSAMELESKYSERNIGCPYTKCYTTEEIRCLLEALGFDSVTVSVRYNVIDHKLQRKVKLAVDDKYELGWHLIFKAKKA